jgi:glucose-1-phosphate cytidylyltransferase
MKVVILAGGLGTRLSEETELRPKPMVEIGGRPILWHIMKLYSRFGHNDFIILLGYKGYFIKEYFANYFLHQNDVTIDLETNRMSILSNATEPWRITLLDTGADTMTGGRLKRAEALLGTEPFMLTYGDGVSDVDMAGLVRFHSEHGKAVTMTAVQPDGRFGAFVASDSQRVASFTEKPRGEGSWVNGGFFVCEPRVFAYLKDGDRTVLEREPLQDLARDGELFAFYHNGFWKCMDTLRDKSELNELWSSGRPPWKTW